MNMLEIGPLIRHDHGKGVTSIRQHLEAAVGDRKILAAVLVTLSEPLESDLQHQGEFPQDAAAGPLATAGISIVTNNDLAPALLETVERLALPKLRQRVERICTVEEAK